jgi:hypothetical protein
MILPELTVPELMGLHLLVSALPVYDSFFNRQD